MMFQNIRFYFASSYKVRIQYSINSPRILNGPFQPVLENPIPLLLIAITSFAVSVDSVSK